MHQALATLDNQLTLDFVVSAPRDTTITLPYSVTVNLVDEVNNDLTPDFAVVVESGEEFIDLTTDGGHLATISYFDADAKTDNIRYGLLPDSSTDANGNIVYSAGMDAETYAAHLAALSIDEESGRIYLANTLPQNAQDFRVVATVTDNGIRVAREIIAIDVDGNGINLPPAILDDSITIDAREGLTANGAILTTISATDTVPVTYAITAGNADGLFSISSNGEVRLASGARLDYDIATQHILTITASSASGTATASVTINVIDRNDGEAGYGILENGNMLELQQAFTDPDGIVPETTSYQWFTTTDGGITKTAITGANTASYDTTNTPATFETYEIRVLQPTDGTVVISDDGTSWSYTRNQDTLAVDRSDQETFTIRIAPEGTRETFDIDISLEISRDSAGDYSYTVGGSTTRESLAAYNTPITGTINLPIHPAGFTHGVTVTYTDQAGVDTNIDVLAPIVGFVDTDRTTPLAFYTGSINEDGTSPSLPTALGVEELPEGFVGTLDWYFVNSAGELVRNLQGFSMDIQTGAITLIAGTTLDYETTPSYNLRARAVLNDGSGAAEEDLYAETWVIITIGDIDEPAPALSPAQIPTRQAEAHQDPYSTDDDPLASIVPIPDTDPYAG